MTDLFISWVRTTVPAVVGAVLAWLAVHGVDLTEHRAAVTAAAGAALTAVYYAVVRAAEKRWPAVGVLLGVRRAPEYPPA